MRIWTISDLHDDVDRFTLPKDIEADVLVVSGDIGGRLSGEGRLWLEANLPTDIPVILVAGNHDFYGASLDDEIDRFRSKTSLTNVHVLDGEAIPIGGTRFVGATLWTDYEVSGDAWRAQKEAAEQMTDFRRISWKGRRNIAPINFYREHARQLDAIRAVLATPFDGPTVVVTHHAPSPLSLQHGKATEMIDGAYASDLSNLILEFEPDLWIHGHVHKSQDYAIGRTKVLANPRGYVERAHSLKIPPKIENPTFDPGLVVDLKPRPMFSWATIEHTLDHPEIYGLPPKAEALPHDEAVRRLQAIRDRFAADPNVDEAAVDRYIAENPDHFPDDDEGPKGPGRR